MQRDEQYAGGHLAAHLEDREQWNAPYPVTDGIIAEMRRGGPAQEQRQHDIDTAHVHDASARNVR